MRKTPDKKSGVLFVIIALQTYLSETGFYDLIVGNRLPRLRSQLFNFIKVELFAPLDLPSALAPYPYGFLLASDSFRLLRKLICRQLASLSGF